MRFDILTLFPGFFDSPLKQSIIGHAIEKGLLEVRVHNIRDYATDKHKITDDAPYGGGPGMVMKVEPVVRALESILQAGLDGQPAGLAGAGQEARANRSATADTAVILTTPQGLPLNHRMARRLAEKKRLVIVCGRYEGVDERIRSFVDMEISAGDYVMTGGEIPALAIMDCVGRLVEGVLGDAESIVTESFAGRHSGLDGQLGVLDGGLLEYPQYTRPELWRGMKVPAVLLSGNHAGIERWRRRERLRRTLERRPDLLDLRRAVAGLDDEDRELMEELEEDRITGH
ncbi:MAG: tRNA (guanosine(37)-N1)-methyltransferase TrmD [Deltaproteobacteria bacterium]|nr:tRNA (guanosine(37)-N1)-methyltransferase TrmD [Deltaproteobacteria bacterium]